MNKAGFAVIDFETTGFSPEHHHRVIELAVVHVSTDGEIQNRWETVVNPMRDLGPTHVHGLTGASVKDAPLFENIAAEFVELLSGRVLVAHNATFEARFLRSELERFGQVSPVENDQALCTMKLAKKFLPGGGRSLAECCAAYDIELENAHRASVDAYATAELLQAYLASGPEMRMWRRYQQVADGQKWPEISSVGAEWVTRDRGQIQQEYCDGLTDAAPPANIVPPPLSLARGDKVVLTGTMPRERSYYEDILRDQGLEPWGGVTKTVRLVIAADPDSLSGKARKARDYGIPIIGVEDFLDSVR